MHCYISPVSYPHTAVLAIVENITWLVWNVSLSAVSVFAAYQMSKTRHRPLRVLFAALWILFIPNTLYMLTDVIHIVGQFGTINKFVDVFLFLWYTSMITLGISCYAWSFEWMMQFLSKNTKLGHQTIYAMGVVMNILIGMAIAMGRFARTNSWYVVTQPTRVVYDLFSIFSCNYAQWFVVAFAIGGMGIFHILYTRMFSLPITAHHKVKSSRSRTSRKSK
ncbi:MAG: DUF1361 domain-containing protein [bacterium]